MVTKLFRNGEDIYTISRELPIAYLTDKEGKTKTDLFNAWKEFLATDKVFRNQTHYIFCETIPDIEYEIIDNQEPLRIS